MSNEANNPSELQLQQALRVAIAATDRGDYAGAMKVFNAVYGDPNLGAPPDGLSAYGLCVAMEEKQTKKGIDLCRSAITAQGWDSRHYINLINLHLKKANRKSAVEVLEEGLGRMPKDSALTATREKIGYRKAPPIPFLSRDSVINRMLARKRGAPIPPRRSSNRGSRIGRLHPLAAGLIVLFVFAAIFGGTFFVLYRQAYG
ncbi:MAG: hypothetical protein ACSLFQ_03370 [Thermoanaerobaculia bacterium]